ncbi:MULTISPECIES: AAA family ATPase [Streptomyces]|uniref:AAA family ATPase n=1 Tax=Streptomyces TaxID=1883 RepID=UPI00068D881D|nr:MoxR family ATPase [Streptomyces durhamensis]
MTTGPIDGMAGPDARDGRTYVPSEQLRLAVKVALATGRPLLLRGEPGTGKSSFASYAAYRRNWRYYEHVVTSRTEARDLLWTFDLVRRLADAQAHRLAEDDRAYVEPGVLWWALAPRSAMLRGHARNLVERVAHDPRMPTGHRRPPGQGAVVLIDEIDKADPDVPNGLLSPLGCRSFVVSETGDAIHVERGHAATRPSGSPLIVVTTNEERELPTAFLRRCLTVTLPAPDAPQLVDIARRHLKVSAGEVSADALELADELARTVLVLRAEAHAAGVRAPSTAEYLDALHACLRLRITPRSKEWTWLKEMALIKDPGMD